MEKAHSFKTDGYNRPCKQGEHRIAPRLNEADLRQSSFRVASCPGNEYRIGAAFRSVEIEFGLTAQNWPEGMTFTRHGQTYTVRDGGLLGADGKKLWL